MNELETLKKNNTGTISPLNEDAKFKFACHPGVSCFNQCCADVNIFLTPYDVLAIKKSSGNQSHRNF